MCNHSAGFPTARTVQFNLCAVRLDTIMSVDINTSPDAEPGKIYRPVIIHRAILGSVERMIAILTESFGGKWPFWLSPRQIAIVPVSPPFYGYAEEVRSIFYEAGFSVEADLGESTLPKKIRNAEIAQYNFIFGLFHKLLFYHKLFQ